MFEFRDSKGDLIACVYRGAVALMLMSWLQEVDARFTMTEVKE